MFNVGDEVSWVSGASGVKKEKRGVVEQVIPAGASLSPSQKKEADAYGEPRDNESYLVRVPGKTAASKGKLYRPLTHNLVLVSSKGEMDLQEAMARAESWQKNPGIRPDPATAKKVASALLSELKRRRV